MELYLASETAEADLVRVVQQVLRKEELPDDMAKLEQLWTRATGDLEFMELCEFSFSDEVFPASGNKEVLS